MIANENALAAAQKMGQAPSWTFLAFISYANKISHYFLLIIVEIYVDG